MKKSKLISLNFNKMPDIEKIKEKIECKLINYVCSACDNSEDLARLKNADDEEVLRLAKKHNISTEE